MPFGTVASTVVVLAILVGLIAFLAFLKKKGKSFTFRVFTALGLGIVLGAGIQPGRDVLIQAQARNEVSPYIEF